MSDTKKRYLKFLIGPALIVISIFFCILLGEIILRIFLPQPLLGKLPGFENVDGMEKYQLLPNQDLIFSTLDGEHQITTSPTGNRGKDPDFVLDKNERNNSYTRLLFCGDSFCFGNGVNNNETLPSLMEKKLSTDSLTIECFNIGQPGYSPPQTMTRTINWLEKWNADKVYYLFYVGNDFYDGDPARINSLWIDDNGVIRVDELSDQEMKTSSLEALRTWLWKNSMLYSLFRRSISAFRSPPPDPALLYSEEFPTDDSLLVNSVSSSLIGLQQYCDTTGIDFTLIIIPSLTQSDDNWWTKFASNYDPQPDRYGPQKWLINYCNTNFIKTINLLSEVEKMGSEAFLPTDRHFTPEAWEKVADYIIEQEKK